jgi:hypothetical protein
MADSMVYINWGRFVAECGCGDAREVHPGQTSETCVNGHTLTLVWSGDTAAAMTALSERVEERRRNWFPEGHPVAVATGQPNGESPTDLLAEQAAYEETQVDRTAQVVAAVQALGLDFDPVTGRVEGL